MMSALDDARIGVEGSSARRPALGVVLIGCLLVLIESAATSRWIGYFHDTGMYLSVLSFAIAGSLFAVSGYYTASTSLVGAPELVRSVRSSGSVLWLRVAGDLVWLLGALAVVHAVAYARTAVASGSLSLMGWSLTVLGLSSATLCYGLGLLVGSLLRRTFGLFVIACVPYALTLYGNGVMSLDVNLQPARALVAPYIDQTWGPSLAPNHGPILLLAGYCVLGAITFTGAAGYRIATGGGVTRPGALLVPLTGAALAGALVFSTVSASDYSLRRTDGYACGADGYVCAWEPNDTERLDMWTAAYASAQAVLADVPHPDLRFAEYNVPVDDDYVVIGTPPGMLTAQIVSNLMLLEYLNRMPLEQCRDDDASRLALAQLLESLSPGSGSENVTGVHDDARRLLNDCT